MRDTALGTPSRGCLVLAASMLMQVCLGATYSWSVIVGFLRTGSELGQRELQTPFTAFYIVFPITTVFAGKLLERFGPRLCALVGTLVFGLGWIVAGFGGSTFILTVIGIGLGGGVGVGLAYLVPIAAGMRWFPHRRGLVTGLAVAGFGGGAALVSQAAHYLMSDCRVDPFIAMRVLGATFLLISIPAALVMCYPPGEEKAAVCPGQSDRLLRRRDFRVLYFAMFAGLSAGFTINANLAQLSPVLADGARVGAMAVALFAITNALGRICWGALADCTQGNAPLHANLILQALLLAVSPKLVASSHGLLLLAAFAGFNYGGVLVLYAASVACIWGNHNVGRAYGILFSANCPAALAPLLAGYVFDKTGSFTGPLLALAVLLLLGSIALRSGLRQTDVT